MLANIVRNKWARRALELMLVLAVFLAARAYMQRDITQGAAPAISGPLLSGEYLDWEALRGRPVLVHFWATWCPICDLEHGSIEAIARDHQVVTVAMQSGTPAEVSAFMAERGLNYPVLVDEPGALARRYGVRGVPASFVVDSAGEIRFVEVGYTTETGLRTRLWLAN